MDVRDLKRGSSFRLFDYEYSVALAFDGRPLAKVIPWVRLSTGLDLTAEQLSAFAAQLDQLGFLESESERAARIDPEPTPAPMAFPFSDFTPTPVPIPSPSPDSDLPLLTPEPEPDATPELPEFTLEPESEAVTVSEPVPVTESLAESVTVPVMELLAESVTGEPVAASEPDTEAPVVVAELAGPEPVTEPEPVTVAEPEPVTEPPVVVSEPDTEASVVVAELAGPDPVIEPEPVAEPEPVTEAPVLVSEPDTEASVVVAELVGPEPVIEPEPVAEPEPVGEPPVASGGPESTALVTEPLAEPVTEPEPVAVAESMAESPVLDAVLEPAPGLMPESVVQNPESTPIVAAGSDEPAPLPTLPETLPAAESRSAEGERVNTLAVADQASESARPEAQAAAGEIPPSKIPPEAEVSAAAFSQPDIPAPALPAGVVANLPPVEPPPAADLQAAAPPAPDMQLAAAVVAVPPVEPPPAAVVQPPEPPALYAQIAAALENSLAPSLPEPRPEIPSSDGAAVGSTSRPHPVQGGAHKPGPRRAATPPPIPKYALVTPAPLRSAKVRGGPWILYALLGIVAALAVSVLVMPLALNTRPAAAVRARVVVVKPTALVRWFEGAAPVEALPSQVLSFPAGGRVIQLASPGVALQPGDVVAATEEARPLLAALARQQERLANFEQLANGLRESGDEKQIRAAEAKVEMNTALVGQAQRALANLALVATVPGQIETSMTALKRNAQQGAPAVRFRPTGLRASFELPRAVAARLRKQGWCGAEIQGRAISCDLATDAGDETHVVIALSAEAAVGQTVRLARVRFADVTLLPPSALSHVGASDRVLVVAPSGRAEVRSVTVADRTPDDVVITQGLDAGDVVIIETSGPVAAGARVWMTESLPE